MRLLSVALLASKDPEISTLGEKRELTDDTTVDDNRAIIPFVELAKAEQ